MKEKGRNTEQIQKVTKGGQKFCESVIAIWFWCTFK